MKVDTNLEIVWYYYTSGVNNKDQLFFVETATDGSIYAGGNYMSSNLIVSSSSDILAMKLNANGLI